MVTLVTFRMAAVRVMPLLALLATTSCTGRYVRPTTEDRVLGTPERLDRGGYLVNSVMSCGVCHTPRVGGTWLGGERSDVYLAGGSKFDDPDGFTITVPNITPDRETGVGTWTDDQLRRAIRDGIHRDGTLMYPPMPFYLYDGLSDDDVDAVVAYLRSIPAVNNRVDRVAKFPFFARMALGLGAAHHKPVRDVKAPPASDRKAYGAYLARAAACVDCHSLTKTGPDLDDNLLAGSKMALGERDYGKVWARNLTPDPETGIGKYDADQIKAALRSGRRLDGKPMAPPMSFLIPHLSTLNDEDLDALVTYLRAVPARKQAIPEPELLPAARKVLGL